MEEFVPNTITKQWVLILCFICSAITVSQLVAQPTSVTLEIGNSAAQNIIWYEGVEETNYIFTPLVDYIDSISVEVSSAGVYFATYKIENCQHSTIPAVVRCVKGCDVTTSVTLVPSISSIEPSNIIWTLDGSPFSNERNLTTSELGTFAAIKSYSTACPADTQFVSVFGLYCHDGDCGNFPWRGGNE